MENKLTILTPTFNRAKILPELYKSLIAQTDYNFTWFIMDDGSTDSTQEIINHYQKEDIIHIVYKYKENAGKHTAINTAVPLIDSKLTFIVDSDDQLTSNAVEEILHIHRKYESVPGLCGYSFLRRKPDGQPMIKKQLPKQEFIASFTECRINDDFPGDMAEVWYTDCLAEYPFAEFPGERFLGEDSVWIKMSDRYKLVFINKTIYISDYLTNGLTNNRRKLNIKSPNGCVLRAEVMLDAYIKVIHKFKAAIQYIIYSLFAGRSCFKLFLMSRHRLLILLAFPAALILYIKWNYNYCKKYVVFENLI